MTDADVIIPSPLVVPDGGRLVGRWWLEFRAADVDEYRARYGKAEGEARFFRDVPLFRTSYAPKNLFMFGGVSSLWQCLIGNGTATAGQPLTFFNAANANVGIGDGHPTALAGTVAVTAGNPAVVGTGTAFTAALVGNYLAFTGDPAVYKVLTFTDATHVTLGTNAATTLSGVAATTYPAEVGTQTDLQATANKARQVVDATYPQHTDGTTSAANTIVYQATFGGTVGNWTTGVWEMGLVNAAAGGRMFNRKVQFQGGKAAGQSASAKVQAQVI